MPQPPLPAPLAPRPDPGAQLLEAVKQRDAQRSLQLAQQWVHRRGVLDLRRFCGTRLDGAQGPEAVAWLQGLLALETPLSLSNGNPTASPQQTAPAGIPIQLDAAGTATPSLSATNAAAWAEPAAAAEPAQQDLQARAVAAVDEAFAALAQSFQEESQALAPVPPLPPLAAEPLTAPLTAPTSAPGPVPVRSGLWPSLRASAAGFGSALRPLRHGSPSPLAEQPQEPQANAAAPGPAERSPDDKAMGDAIPLQAPPSPSAGVPQAPPSPPLPATADLVSGSGEAAAQEPLQPLDAAQVRSEPAASAATTPADATSPAPDGLLARLRGRLQPGRLPRLKRLRTVMQDCVEETVALLRTPAPERHEQDSGFELSQPPEPTWSAREQPGISWTLDPFLPPPPPPAASSEPQPDATAMERPAPAAAPSRLRFSLPASKPATGGERPAPAPDSLSDLRAWLPDRGDLPRAS